MKIERRKLLVLYAVAILVVVTVFAVRGARKGNDFRAYHLAAVGALEGDLIPAYEDRERPFQYPPPFAYLVLPFGLLPYGVGGALWAVLKAILVIEILRRLDDVLGVPLTAEAKLGGFLLVLRMLDSDFSTGNANVLVLALSLLALGLARRRKDSFAGGALAAACLSKASPALLTPWIVLRRRWRLAGATLAAAVVLAVIVPMTTLGWRGTEAAWSAWLEGTFSSVDPTSKLYVAEPGQGYIPGQSLRAFVHRTLRESDATAHDHAYVSIAWFDLPKSAADGIWLGLSAAIFVGVVLLLRWRHPGISGGWAPGELAAAFALVPMLGPLSRKAHFVFLWPAATLAFEAWLRASGRTRKVGAVLWGLALLLVVGTSRDILGKQVATYAAAYCPYFWAGTFLLAVLIHPDTHPRSPRRLSAQTAKPGCADE